MHAGMDARVGDQCGKRVQRYGGRRRHVADAGRERKGRCRVPRGKRARARHPHVAREWDVARQTVGASPPCERLDREVDHGRGDPERREPLGGRAAAGSFRRRTRAARRRSRRGASSRPRARGGSSPRRATVSGCGQWRRRPRDPGARRPRSNAAGASRIRHWCSSSGDRMRRRLAAVVALVVGAATVALAIAVAVSEFPRGLGRAGLRVDRRRGGLVRPAAERGSARGRADRCRAGARGCGGVDRRWRVTARRAAGRGRPPRGSYGRDTPP